MMIEYARALIGQRAAKASPVDSRITVRLVRIEQIAVFDKEQRIDYDGRNRLEARIGAAWKIRAEKRCASAVEELQTGLVFLGIRQKKTSVRERKHAFRIARLCGDFKAALQQALLDGRQQRVTEARVVRTFIGFGKADGMAWTVIDREADVAGQFGQIVRLQPGRFYFELA
ncbi:conserved hypothetical protein [Paraburkholderia graminis C4D1M]|uniref:Uncharacterized protein n=1 Tax=Paraburkholderia graminis (strain ATCC 700544 / DSM 17151 / LMG 18924 / NCIMB 13744 / C4D1M) TaxID=396598 RepID=B1G9W0_PARG4|nr:conserved hypothetical protein [Paraburkholderia graminis C4D1M]